MSEDKILSDVADRNVAQLNRVDKALQGLLPAQREMVRQRQAQAPGSRPDGGMAVAERTPVDIVRNAMVDARRIVDNFEKEVISLESQIAQLKAQLDAERDVRQNLERMLAEITELVSPR